jgi:hypothetical protein
MGLDTAKTHSQKTLVSSIVDNESDYSSLAHHGFDERFYKSEPKGLPA